jgi:hypothetical protein
MWINQLICLKKIMTTNPHIISLTEAAEMTHAFQNDTRFLGMTVACMMGNDAYGLVTSQIGCTGLRTYFALTESGTLTIVVVGVDQNGNDMTNGVILERSYNCPIDCPGNSPLM